MKGMRYSCGVHLHGAGTAGGRGGKDIVGYNTSIEFLSKVIQFDLQS